MRPLSQSQNVNSQNINSRNINSQNNFLNFKAAYIGTCIANTIAITINVCNQSPIRCPVVSRYLFVDTCPADIFSLNPLLQLPILFLPWLRNGSSIELSDSHLTESLLSLKNIYQLYYKGSKSLLGYDQGQNTSLILIKYPI